jgi:hypothetical protein
MTTVCRSRCGIILCASTCCGPVQGCWQVLSPTRKETSYSDRRFWCSCILFIIIIGGILVLYIYIYITRLASNEIFSPSNKIHREVGRAKDLSASRYVCRGASVLWTLPGCPTAYCLLHHPMELDRVHPSNCCTYNRCVLSSSRFTVVDLRVLSQFKLIHSPAITFPWTALRFVIVLFFPHSCLSWYKRFPLSVGKTRVLRSGFGSGTFSSPSIRPAFCVFFDFASLPLFKGVSLSEFFPYIYIYIYRPSLVRIEWA